MQVAETVLILDDDEISNFLVSRILDRSGLCKEVIAFQDGKEGLNLLQKCIDCDKALPDIILLDVNMPAISGYEFLKELTIRNIPTNQTKILVLSNVFKDNQKEEMKELGASGFLTKPFTREKLLEALQE